MNLISFCHTHAGPGMVGNRTSSPTTSTSLNAALVTQPVAPIPLPAAKVRLAYFKNF